MIANNLMSILFVNFKIISMNKFILLDKRIAEIVKINKIKQS